MNSHELNKRPVIYVLVGLPGSGKSTWTHNMLSKSEDEFIVISSDDVLERIAAEKGKTYSEVYQDHVGFATSEMKRIATEAFKTGKNIVWDQTNMTAKKRRGILQQVPKNYDKIAVDFDVPDSELKRRLEDRAKTTGKYIPQSVIISMGASYQAPTRDEGFDKIIKIKTK